ncbi:MULTISPECIES: recombinase family protein [Vibrio]|uniref:recombinase family protein n=1 Tax=Vibrio TaxID=662 RepID=UPI00148BF1FA|nr:recombinase family protein [Vibrio mediterranei]MCG9660442.1 recombinase family protein [Vibrio mediterranei]NOI26622.1 recombinase family protein [Vibrio mediterranei]
MIFGYQRISTKEQEFDLQTDALRKYGCEKIFSDIASGAKTSRPALNELITQLRPHDVIVVYKLDRLGRSLKHLIELIDSFTNMEVGIVSLNDPIDTTSPHGRLITNVFASMAEFERELIIERTKAGLSAARARGRKGGRPEGISKEAENKAAAAEALYKDGKLSISEICQQLSIARSTLYKYLRIRGVEVNLYNRQPQAS